jgi:hypothetical protein
MKVKSGPGREEEKTQTNEHEVGPSCASKGKNTESQKDCERQIEQHRFLRGWRYGGLHRLDVRMAEVRPDRSVDPSPFDLIAKAA